MSKQTKAVPAAAPVTAIGQALAAAVVEKAAAPAAAPAPLTFEGAVVVRGLAGLVADAAKFGKCFGEFKPLETRYNTLRENAELSLRQLHMGFQTFTQGKTDADIAPVREALRKQIRDSMLHAMRNLTITDDTKNNYVSAAYASLDSGELVLNKYRKTAAETKAETETLKAAVVKLAELAKAAEAKAAAEKKRAEAAETAAKAAEAVAEALRMAAAATPAPVATPATPAPVATPATPATPAPVATPATPAPVATPAVNTTTPAAVAKQGANKTVTLMRGMALALETHALRHGLTTYRSELIELHNATFGGEEWRACKLTQAAHTAVVAAADKL